MSQFQDFWNIKVCVLLGRSSSPTYNIIR